jgi:hypothetical protein
MDFFTEQCDTIKRPYTVGFSIAAGLILSVAVGKFIVKKVKKWLSSNQPDICAITPKCNPNCSSERKVLPTNAQKREIFVKYENEFSGTDTESPSFMIYKSSKADKKSSIKQKELPDQEGGNIVFFAGYSHLHYNEA